MGEVFAGRYELADPIGRGGVGAVWRAWDHRRRRYVAAKVLQQRDAHSLLRFVREQALRIDHPHVLAPASWAADDDKVLFTMDLVTGGSLVHLVGDYGPLPPAFVCTLLDQLLSGLAAVHAEGVVHRDIKPANVLLEATGTARPRLRLSDFGIAMRLGEPRLTETNLVVGTPGYLAPEQMMGAEPDFPADLFAVGLVALYLLEGAKPDAKALVQYFAEHGTPGAPKGIPEALWEVVATLLQPDPHARFRTATGARKALASAAQLLPEPGPDDELIEIFDQIGPLPRGFGPDGPLKRAHGTTAVPLRPGEGPLPAPPDTPPTPVRPHEGPPPARPATPPGLARPGTDSLPALPGAAPGSAFRATGSPPARPVTPPRPAHPAPDASPSARPGTGSLPGDPRLPANPAEAEPHTPTPSMSDTGSFHLPPPQPTVTSFSAADADANADAHATPTPTPRPPAHAPAPASTPTPASAPRPHTALAPAAAPYDSTFALPSRARGAVGTSTASYTAQDPQVPAAAQAVPPRRGHRAGRRARRRGGPPARVAVPMLLLALVCYAVGFWALARM
jgi:serine/threonine protein kinase